MGETHPVAHISLHAWSDHVKRPLTQHPYTHTPRSTGAARPCRSSSSNEPGAREQSGCGRTSPVCINSSAPVAVMKMGGDPADSRVRGRDHRPAWGSKPSSGAPPLPSSRSRPTLSSGRRRPPPASNPPQRTPPPPSLHKTGSWRPPPRASAALPHPLERPARPCGVGVFTIHQRTVGRCASSASLLRDLTSWHSRNESLARVECDRIAYSLQQVGSALLVSPQSEEDAALPKMALQPGRIHLFVFFWGGGEGSRC